MRHLLTQLRWYRNRLAAMSAAEILYRGRESTRRRFDRTTARRLIAAPRDYGALPEIPGLNAGLDAWHIPPALLAQWQQDAHTAQNNAHIMFGVPWPPTTHADKWHLDPVSNTSWPRDTFCFKINYRHNGARGDIKYVWELNRLQYLQPTAALARKTGDTTLAHFCLTDIENWIDNNPAFRGVNWNSGIELALRSLSILTVVSLVGTHASRETRAKIWASLHTHARWIARYPSRHSSANNHRTAEGLGLFAIGALCPHFPEAARWRQTGWAILCDAAQRQILPDGAGAEQAVAYAASVLEILLTSLTIAQAANIPVPAFYRARLTQGGEYLRWLTDANGNLPHIGDDDNACLFGAYHTGDQYPAAILAAVAAVTKRADLSPPNPQPHLRQALFGIAPPPDFPPYGMRTFSHGGMTIGRHPTPQGDVMLAFDHGYLGYLSIAAHGHADALAVWLHIGGQPVFVDAGTYLYHAPGDERRHFRGTPAHNTLSISATDSSTMSGNFNWSRQARATVCSADSRGDFWQAEAEHDGYLENFHALHRRRLSVSPASGAVIEDQLIGTAAEPVDIGFLLHPALTARHEGPEILIFAGEKLLVRVRHESDLTASLADATYSPAFGIRQPTTRLVFSGLLAPYTKATTRLFWSF